MLSFIIQIIVFITVLCDCKLWLDLYQIWADLLLKLIAKKKYRLKYLHFSM